MGVDWFPCDNCDETFPDAGPYALCEDCSGKLCCKCMKKLSIRDTMVAKIENYDPDEYSQCPFCSREIITNADLLTYALNRLGKTRKELEQELRN